MDKLGISLLSMKSKNFHTILSVLKKMFEILLLKLNSVSFWKHCFFHYFFLIIQSIIGQSISRQSVGQHVWHTQVYTVSVKNIFKFS